LPNDYSVQRAHPRFDLDVELRIRSPEATGRTMNLSFGGLAAKMNDAPDLVLGQVVDFSLELDDGALELKGSLCWRAGEVIGLSFEGLNRAQRSQVSNLVASLRDSAKS
jgi:hypothetical protein